MKTSRQLLQERMNSEKIKSSIWGFILGDVWGVPYEFKTKGSFKFQEFDCGGFHDQESGVWSDDTSLMLAFMDAYDSEELNIDRHKECLRKFLKGEYSYNRVLFDIGISTRQSISNNFTKNTDESYGNGGLLRCWLASALKPDTDFSEILGLTHSSQPIYKYCFDEFGELLRQGWNNQPFELKPEIHTVYKNGYDKLKNSNGTVVSSFELCKEGLKKKWTIKNIIEQAKDTDSDAALFGALYYSNREFPQEYKEQIKNWKWLEEQIDNFLNGNTKKSL